MKKRKKKDFEGALSLLDLAQLPKKNVIQQEATDPHCWAICP